MRERERVRACECARARAILFVAGWFFGTNRNVLYDYDGQILRVHHDLAMLVLLLLRSSSSSSR